MALFKISKGSKDSLPTTMTEGFCWYTYDDSKFYIDHKDENGVLTRKALNAHDAETLTGASLATILNSSDIEIPTSKAVFDAIATKANQTDLDGIGQMLSSIQDYVNQVDGELATTKEDVAEHGEQLSDLSEAVSTLEETIVGLSGAMNFKGVVETNPANITEGYKNGDVVIYGNKEYVWNNNAFVEFGDATANAEAITGLTITVNGIGNTVGQHSSTLETVNTTLGQINSIVGTLSQELQKTQDEVSSKTPLADFNAACNAFNYADAGHNTRLSALEESIATKASQESLNGIGQMLVSIQDYTNQVDKGLTAAKEDIADHDEKITALEAKFGEGEGTVEDMIADAIATVSGQAEFATVSNEDWGKDLTTQGRLHLNADAIMINNASFAKDTAGFGVLTGITVPENTSPFTAVNKQYVDEAVAGVGGSGGGQAEFATVTSFEGGKTLTTEGRLHIDANAVMINGVSITPLNDGSYLSTINGVAMDTSGYPYCAVNKEYVDTEISGLKTYIENSILGGSW